MQYDDEANRTTGNEPLAEYSVVDESVVDEPDEQAAGTDPRGGSDQVWQGVQPVDPDLDAGESVDESSGTDTPEDPDLAATGLDETNTEGSGPGTVRTNPDIDRTDSNVDRDDVDIDPSDEATTEAVGGTAAAGTADTATQTTDAAARTDNDDPLRTRWHEAQHMFVDDPAGAVRKAAALVQAAAEHATTTHDGPGTESGPDTEQLRITMQRYHEAFELLVGISSRDIA